MLALRGAAAVTADADPQDSAVAGATTDSTVEDALREMYAGLRTQLEQSPFQRPLHLESTVEPQSSKGDVYAVVDHPMSRLTGSLTNPDNWCEVLILHLNVKSCRAGLRDGHAVLLVAIGRKYDQPLKKAYRVEFTFCVTSLGANYMSVVLDAGEGPFGTRDYRIALEAVALEDEQALLHLQYSLNYGFQARVALKFYLVPAAARRSASRWSFPTLTVHRVSSAGYAEQSSATSCAITSPSRRISRPYPCRSPSVSREALVSGSMPPRCMRHSCTK